LPVCRAETITGTVIRLPHDAFVTNASPGGIHGICEAVHDKEWQEPAQVRNDQKKVEEALRRWQLIINEEHVLKLPLAAFTSYRRQVGALTSNCRKRRMLCARIQSSSFVKLRAFRKHFVEILEDFWMKY
jgi:hypothetical protein